MFSKQAFRATALTVAAFLFVSTMAAYAEDKDRVCKDLPNFSALKNALLQAVATESSGLNNQMWATLVNRDGVVCAVAFSGVNRGAQWPGSRVISAQKANTANAFGLDHTSNSNGSGQPDGLALSTANLYSAVQPGGSLWTLASPTAASPSCTAPRSTPWSATRSAASMCLAVDWGCMHPDTRSSAA